MPRHRPLPTYRAAYQEEQLRRRRAGRLGVVFMVVLLAALTLPELLATPTYSARIPAAAENQPATLLPDGSQAALEPGTAMEVRYYKHRREVTLEDGAAEFRIAKDANRAFEAKASIVAARTEDDASFGMRRAGTAVRVEVRSGTVEVSEGRRGMRRSVTVHAGQGVQTKPNGGLTRVFLIEQ
jgi:ferric-dicitrate binding protein FerR (iron transport regulator)